ncbi:MAG: tripartite tricarboxylate transporter permease [Thermodesulfobacteriota bacterium]|nr:tripartite tricarboxylate transporter permease [Thermodesulfobacteriota bacterium]
MMEEIFNAFIGGLLANLQLKPFLYMLIGVAIGFWVGILPGLGGGTTLALMLPFIYKMTPQEAFPFLLGMHSVCATTGDITSVLFGIPGEATTVATIVDGYPMAKKGEAGRALGAVLMSSLVGAIFGAFYLAFTIPIVRPLVLAFGSPEMFMLIILGLACIATLSGHGKRGLLLGLMSGGFGLLCSLVGQDRQAGILRFTFGQLYLWNGLPIIPVMIGIFAIPEIVDLAVRRTAIAGDVTYGKLGKGVMDGIKDTFRHFWLTVRCSFIGSLIGTLPGLGGAVAQWIAYAHATQSAKTEEERAGFGKGDIRGVLGPGAANNSKEGAGLVPTVAFGIPTGPGMAILLAAFFVMGLVPGPDMLSKHLTLTYSMAWTIVISNVVAVSVSLLFINHIAKLTTIRGNLINPIILLLCFVGAYTTQNHIGDLITLLIFGGIGYFMVRYRWPRPPFILGFILGKLAETYLYTSTTRYGITWLYRPKVIILFFIIVAFVLYPYIQKRFRREDLGEPDRI